MKTRADDTKIIVFCAKLGKEWDWAVVVANGFSGGIITLWRKHIERVTSVTVSRKAFHLVISYNNNVDWVLYIIYNATQI